MTYCLERVYHSRYYNNYKNYDGFRDFLSCYGFMTRLMSEIKPNILSKLYEFNIYNHTGKLLYSYYKGNSIYYVDGVLDYMILRELV